MPYSNPANIKPATARTLPPRLPNNPGDPADDEEGLDCVAEAGVAETGVAETGVAEADVAEAGVVEADVVVAIRDGLVTVLIMSLAAEVKELDEEDEINKLAVDSESTFLTKELMIDS